MIAKMKKVTLIAASGSKAQAMKALAEAQVFHTGRLEGQSGRLADLAAQKAQIEQALNSLPAKGAKKGGADGIERQELVSQILQLASQKKAAEEQAAQALREAARIAAWGDFSPDALNALQEAGIFIRLYEIEKKQLAAFKKEAKAALFACGKAGSKRLIAAVAREEGALPRQNAADLPKIGLAALKQEAEQGLEGVRRLDKELQRLAGGAAVLKAFLAEIESQIEYENALEAMQDDTQLAFIQGYIPASDLKSFKELAAANAWAALYADPSENEIGDVPTKLKNRGVSALPNTVLSMLEYVPGYKEFDIGFIMFFFFTLFVAMLIGDGGYGLVFLLIGLTGAGASLKKKGRVPLFLLYVIILSLAVIVWGALTGSWFGMQFFKELPFLKQFIEPWFADNSNLQFFCFVIGAFHLLIAHGWAALRHLRTGKGAGKLTALADLGNFAMVASLFFVAFLLVLGKNVRPQGAPDWLLLTPDGALPFWVLPAVFSGFGASLLFGKQEQGLNPFKAALLGLADIFPATLAAIGNMSDIISYIRLYAVGLAGFAIADSFNTMAFAAPAPAGFFILLGAHTLNLALCVLSVMVHGIRLNTLEFSNHLGISWSGTAYKPFGSQK